MREQGLVTMSMREVDRMKVIQLSPTGIWRAGARLSVWVSVRGMSDDSFCASKRTVPVDWSRTSAAVPVTGNYRPAWNPVSAA